MSDIGLIGGPESPGDDDGYYEKFSSRKGRRSDGPRRPRRSWIPALILLLIAAVVVAGGTYGFGRLKAHFASAPDYPGPGTGQVVFQVNQGDSVTAMGQGLAARGVVKSLDAFLAAARKDSRSSTIQVGYYRMQKQMSGASALAVLVNPKNLIQSLVTVPEGSRLTTIVNTIVKKTDLKRAALKLALKQPAKLGLPKAAKGNPEGYLFPATYTVLPKETALGLLQQMVAKTVSVEKQLSIDAKAKQLGLSSEQVLTVASILEFEASRTVDYPKVARAIYNRLAQGMALQSDATVAYANGTSGTVYTTDQQRALDSPYNTYKYPGLPPGPIGSPGEATINAALNPSTGKQLYWVVVNLRTGETRYADTYGGHLKNVALFRKYCETSSAC